MEMLSNIYATFGCHLFMARISITSKICHTFLDIYNLLDIFRHKSIAGLCSACSNVPWNTECKRARYVAVTNKAKTGLQDFWWLRGLALACTGLNEPAAGSGPRKAYLRLSAAAEKVARRRFRSSAPAVCRPGPDEMLRLFIIGIAPRQHADIAVGERRIHPHAETIRDNFLARRRG